MKLSDTIRVNVRREHIKKGKRRSCSYCPIALALMELSKIYGWGLLAVNIGGTEGQIYLEGIGKQFYLPKKAQDFIRDFDGAIYGNEEYKPFHFDIQLRSIPLA